MLIFYFVINAICNVGDNGLCFLLFWKWFFVCGNRHRANLGYAFVNFTSSVAAARFHREFDNFFWTNPRNKKVCQITVAKFQVWVSFGLLGFINCSCLFRVIFKSCVILGFIFYKQGKEELSQHFKDSRFPCHTNEYLPVVLSPPSDGYTGYNLKTLGYRVGLRGGPSRRAWWFGYFRVSYVRGYVFSFSPWFSMTTRDDVASRPGVKWKHSFPLSLSN